MTTLADLLKPALRIAGITMLPGTTPSIDQYGELIPALNRLMGSWNLDGHRIFTKNIAVYPLVTGQKIYTIGPGGQFNTARPVFIRIANFLFPGTPTVRRHIHIASDEEWSRIAVQDIAGAPPYVLYYDGSYDSSGLASIYLEPQPPTGYSIELYTWQALPDGFVAVTDLVTLPPGYEHAIVTNLALEAATLYPRDAMLHPLAPLNAQKALSAVRIMNIRCPGLISEAANLGSSIGSGQQGQGLVVGSGGGSGGAALLKFTITGAINGTTGSDGNAVFTLNVSPTYLMLHRNGEEQTPGVSYTLSGNTITFLAPNIPLSGDNLLAEGTSS